MGNNILGWQTSRIYNSKHISSLSTNGSTNTGNHCIFPLMSLNPLAPAFLPHYQSSSDPPIPLGNSTAMSLPLAQLFCGMLSQSIPFLAFSTNQHITDGTLLLPLLQPRNQSKPDAAVHQPTPGSSALLPSSLQHQANCQQAIHKTIQQSNQHLKAEHLDRQTLQLIVLQLKNDFALLRYVLFSPVETISNKDITVKNSATSPLLNSKPNLKPNPNPNTNPTSFAFPLSGSGEPKLHRSTPVGAVGSPRAKTNKSAKVDFQPTPNMQEAPATMVQNPASRISKLEKLFADEISTNTSFTAGTHSQYFFLYDKIRQPEAGASDVIIWKIPSVKFVFDSAKVARQSSGPLIEPATSFSSPIFRTHPMDTTFSSNSTLMVLDPLLASVLQSYSPSFLETMTKSNGPSQSSSRLVFEISWTQ